MNVTTSKSGDYIERVTSLKPNKPKVKEIKKTNGREQFQMI